MDPDKPTPHKPSISMGLSQSVENDTDLDDDTQARLDIIDEKHDQIESKIAPATHIHDDNDIDVTTTVHYLIVKIHFYHS